MHQRYGADAEPAIKGKARKSILHAFGKRSKDEKEEQQRSEVAHALYSAALAKVRQGVCVWVFGEVCVWLFGKGCVGGCSGRHV